MEDIDSNAALLLEVRELSRRREHAKAVDLCNDILTRDPSCCYAYSSRSAGLSALNRQQEALADINKAIELDPSHLGFRHHRGGLQYFLEQDAKAVEDFTHVIDHDEQRYFTDNARFWRAMANLRLGLKDKARDDAVHIPPDFLELDMRQGEESR